ncbi:hypothetical protein Taro_028441 [Colocasia esculenta]|uniref:Uncharacterized protein n=1 Tax=Colocasia esculenta TaxID=4460 RepID=A0A843VIJ2_COLES|nr:hypothetical protein [Colocasia esculenta]
MVWPTSWIRFGDVMAGIWSMGFLFPSFGVFSSKSRVQISSQDSCSNQTQAAEKWSWKVQEWLQQLLDLQCVQALVKSTVIDEGGSVKGILASHLAQKT